MNGQLKRQVAVSEVSKTKKGIFANLLDVSVNFLFNKSYKQENNEFIIAARDKWHMVTEV